MIVYSGTKSRFHEDVMTNDIGGIIATTFNIEPRVPDTGGSYTVKKYTSRKKYAPDGTWEHEEIILKALNPEYKDIVIPNAEDEEFTVVAEVVGMCTSC